MGGNGGCHRSVKTLRMYHFVQQTGLPRTWAGGRWGNTSETPDPAGSTGSGGDFILGMRHTLPESSAAASAPGASVDIRSLNGYWSLGPGN